MIVCCIGIFFVVIVICISIKLDFFKSEVSNKESASKENKSVAANSENFEKANKSGEEINGINNMTFTIDGTPEKRCTDKENVDSVLRIINSLNLDEVDNPQIEGFTELRFFNNNDKVMSVIFVGENYICIENEWYQVKDKREYDKAYNSIEEAFIN